jgi:hypothetical protein
LTEVDENCENGQGYPFAPAPFVVGVPRSGTTLLRLMLDAHPLVAILPETHFVPKLLRRCGDDPDLAGCAIQLITSHPRWRDFGLDAGELEVSVARQLELTPAAVLRCFYGLYAKQHGKPRWGDKTPWYMKSMRKIGAALPEARFLHLIRDGRDVALSLLGVDWGPATITEAAERWRQDIRKARRQARHLDGGRYLELRFEDLVSDPEAMMRRVGDFAELPWDPAVLSHHEVSRERFSERFHDLPGRHGPGLTATQRSSEHQLIDEPPRRDRTGRWKREMSAADRAQFEEIAGGLLVELGYEG